MIGMSKLTSQLGTYQDSTWYPGNHLAGSSKLCPLLLSTSYMYRLRYILGNSGKHCGSTRLAWHVIVQQLVDIPKSNLILALDYYC